MGAEPARASTASSPKWKPGDRVWVNPTMWRNDWVQATVRRVDPDGVLVDLDHPVRGLSDCYATHAELRAVDTAACPRCAHLDGTMTDSCYCREENG